MLGPLLGRLLRLAVVLVLVLVVAVGGLLTIITARSLAQTGGSLRLAGLHASASIFRDANGIAQISAGDPHDLFMAQGYLHASERFWQMEVYRHAGAGRLSELFGKSTLKQDTFIRTLGLRQAGQADLDAMSPEGKGALQAYADGVNAWLDAHRGSLGLPFVVVGLKAGLGGGLGGYDPEPWTPLDSATFAKIQALVLAGNFDSEVFRQAADARLGDRSLTDQLFPAYPANGPIEVPTGAAGSGGAGASGTTAVPATGDGAIAAGSHPSATVETAATNAATTAGWLDLGRIAQSVVATTGLDATSGLGSDRGIGSNDWVVGPSKSATGHALLANDPHLGLAMPSVWFINGLHCRQPGTGCPYDVVGVSFPSAPAVVLGHNERIAWGATNVEPDVQDLFQEQVDPKDPTHYMFKGQSIAFQVRHEVIKVAGGADVAIEVRSTGHGPVISDVSDRLKIAGVFALRWTATLRPDHILDAFLGIDRAGNWTEFRAALAGYVAPSQNFVYADVDGNIGLQVPGLIPIRQDPRDLGDRPVPGWTGTHEWTGYIKYDDLPRLFNPPSAIIATANAAPVDAKYPYLIGREWDPGYRVGRITALLSAAAAKGGVTRDTMSAIQMDTFVARAPLVIDRIGDVVPATDDGRTLLARIRAWKGRCDVDSVGCAAYMTFEYRVLRGLFDPRLGLDLARDYVGSTESWQALIALLDQPTSPWWNDPATPATESKASVVRAAIDGAAADLRATFGDPAQWTWGREHTITFEEGALGQRGIPVLTWYLNAGPFPVAGAAGAIDNTYYHFSAAYPDPTDATYKPGGLLQVFDVTNGPSYRLAIDMGDLDGARIVITTGQSGNPFDRHYGDMIPGWLNGTGAPLPFSPGAAQKATVSTLNLLPPTAAP